MAVFTGTMMQLSVTYCPTTTFLFSLIFIGQTRGLGGCAVHLQFCILQANALFSSFLLLTNIDIVFLLFLHLFVPPTSANPLFGNPLVIHHHLHTSITFWNFLNAKNHYIWKLLIPFLEEAKFSLSLLFPSLWSTLLLSFQIPLCCESKNGQIFCTNILNVVKEKRRLT